MAHRSRRRVTILIAAAATLGFVGVSAALEGEDPTLGAPEVTCADPSDGTVDEGGATDDGATSDEGVTTDEGTDATVDGGTVDEGTTDDAADETDGAADETDDGAVTDEGPDGGDDCEEPATTDDEGEADEDEADEDATDDEGTTDDGTTDDGAAPESAELENHGAAVSQAAHDCPPGPEHGPCVRDVAHSDAGKKAKGHGGGNAKHGR
jgi:hypothetical protein